MCVVIMAGKTKYEMAFDVLKEYKGRELHIEELRKIIMMKLGSDPRTVISYLKMMEATDLIKEIRSLIYEIK